MATIASSLALKDKFTNTINKAVQGTNRLLKAMDAVGTSKLDANIKHQMEAALEAIQSAEKELKNLVQKMNQADNASAKMMSGIKSMIASLAAGFTVKFVVEQTDLYASNQARLGLINDGLQTQAELQQKIYAAAQRSRGEYNAMVDSIAKLGLLAGDAFGSNSEMIAFAEQLNKAFTISGATTEQRNAAMLQLTQAMASGRLQGDEYVSVMENAPMVIDAIAKYTGKTKGELKELSSEGYITAEIVKNAMLSSADEINRKFESMPYTYSQVWTMAQNILMDSFQPVLQMIGAGAQLIVDNWGTIEPVFWGLAAAGLAYAVALGIQTTATWIATGAARTFFTTLLTNPLLWIALVIGVVVAAIYQWVQAVGGLENAWAIAMDYIRYGTDLTAYGISYGVTWVLNSLDRMELGAATLSTNFQNFMGDMRAGALTQLQELANGGIGIINDFISTLNKIPGVSIDLIDQLTFGTIAGLENEAAKQQRSADLAARTQAVNDRISSRDTALATQKATLESAHAARRAENASRVAAAAEKAASDSLLSAAGGAGANQLDSIGKVGEVGKINSDVNIADEDLQLMKDVAEMRYVQNFVTLTPTVAMNAQVSERVDIDELTGRVADVLIEEVAAGAEGVY